MFQSTINKDITLFVNNDDPIGKSLEDYAGKTIYYSLDKNSKSFEKNGFYNVSIPCPKCSNKIIYKYYNVNNMGKFECSNCDYQNMNISKVNVKLSQIDYEKNTFNCGKDKYQVSYMNSLILYNYALTIAVCNKYYIKYRNIQKSFQTFINSNEIIQTYKYHGKTIKYITLNQENSETLQSAIDVVSSDKSKKIFYMGLYTKKNIKTEFTNTSYLFDCDFEKIVNAGVEEYVLFSTPTAYDIATRLIYAGANRNILKIYDNEENLELIFSDIDRLDVKTIYIITSIKQYRKVKSFFEKK